MQQHIADITWLLGSYKNREMTIVERDETSEKAMAGNNIQEIR